MENNRIFLNYINTPLSQESLAIIYDANNIRFEKCELYCDYIQSLLTLVFETYMGDDMMTEEDQIKHFEWCWNKNMENFKDEGFLFINPSLHRYFKEFVFDYFYFLEDKTLKNTHLPNMDLWGALFNYNIKKTSFDVDILIETYNIFNNSLVIK